MDVIVTNHAYDQYLNRVGEIERDELTKRLLEQLEQPHRKVKDLIQLEGIWWAYKNGYFITCYGNTHIDLPAALTWAAINNDRIVL